MTHYDPIVEKVLAKYPECKYKKVYHAGETKHPDNNNIELSLQMGSVRIGHGINILLKPELL